MTQETDSKAKLSDKKRLKDAAPTKVVIRRLPPSLTAEALLEQISPLPNYDFFYFMKADFSLGANAFSRAYINFQNYEDIASFRDKFDDYVFVDGKGNEYPAIVEFSSFQKVPKKRAKKLDSKKGTIEEDPDYLKFLDSLQNPTTEDIVSIETYLEQLEAREREAKATKGGPRVSTPLIEYIKKRKEEKRNSILRAREDRKKREQERKQQRDEERRKRREREDRLRQKDRDRQKDRGRDRDEEKEVETPVKLLKKPDRENEKEDIKYEKDKDKTSDQKKEKDVEKDKDSSKGKEEKPKLRFSKENREKQREERKDERGKLGASKPDRPRSGRDDWSSDKSHDRDDRKSDRDRLPRPKSYRDEREQRRANRESDYYRDKGGSRDGGRDRPGSASKSGSKPDSRDPPRRVDRDTARSDRVDRKPDKPPRLDKDSPKLGPSKYDRDRDSFKGDRDRVKCDTKVSDKSKPLRGGREDSPLEAAREDDLGTADDKRRKRKERPERAIYDPRKALERRQGAKKDTAKDDTKDSPRESSVESPKPQECVSDKSQKSDDGTPV